MDKLELGVFLPIANNGWIVSKNAPQYSPTFQLQKDIAQLAESIGLDYLLTMIKWRGFGGETKHWNESLESFTLMSGLAAVTERIGIIASVQPLIFNPAVAAKMAATVDEISGGRFGMNLVMGQYFDEYAQMGILPDGYAAERYEYGEEWIEMVKMLWSEDRVTYKGRYYTLDDCMSDPKPIQKPHPPLMCAGMSERGMRFTAKHGAYSFITGESLDGIKAVSRRAKEVAAEAGKSIKTSTVLVIIQGDTDDDAQRLMQHYRDGVDVEAWSNISNIYARDPEGASSQHAVERAKKAVFFGFLPVAGSAQTIADTLSDMASELDGILFTFPDYLEGLKEFDEKVRPLMEDRVSLSAGSQRTWKG